MGNDTLGPLTQALFNFVWTKVLFVRGSSIYVPDIILNGDPSRGFVSYDPYVVTSPLAPQSVNVAQSTRDTACLRLDTPQIPIGVGAPTLTLTNIKIVNLHAMQPIGGLTFPPAYKVAAQVQLGQLDGQAMPLTFATHDPTEVSFIFCQHCCVPDASTPPQCIPGQDFDNYGHGTFNASITQVTMNLSITVDPTNITVSAIDQIVVAFDPKAVTYQFTVEESGGEMGKEAMIAMVNAAIQTGISNNLVQDQINALFESSDLRNHLRDLINQALADALPHLPADARPLTAAH